MPKISVRRSITLVCRTMKLFALIVSVLITTTTDSCKTGPPPAAHPLHILTPTTSNCGVPGPIRGAGRAHRSIVGGQRVNDWRASPWTMLLQRSMKQEDDDAKFEFEFSDKDNVTHCGAILVHVRDGLQQSNILVTTADCVLKREESIYELASLRVIARLNNINNVDKAYELTQGYRPTVPDDPIVYQVDDVLPYPKYHDLLKDGNVALVRVKPAINYDDFMRSICLPTATWSDSVLERKLRDMSSKIVGWGERDGHLEQVQLSILDDEDCREKRGTVFLGRAICAKGTEEETFSKEERGIGVACQPLQAPESPMTLCAVANHILPETQEVGGVHPTRSSFIRLTGLDTNVLDWINKNIRQFSRL